MMKLIFYNPGTMTTIKSRPPTRPFGQKAFYYSFWTRETQEHERFPGEKLVFPPEPTGPYKSEES